MMATKLTLSKMQSVDLRECWENEALDFTPWLAQPESLAILSDAVGMELELFGTEQNVGKFSADIVCRNIGTGEWVLIENQLANTDHSHLGQLLTYAAGLHASTIIWVAREFRDEHRAAIDWLNENTVPEIRFFGLEVKLWRIGNQGPVAPSFDVVCKPNNYSKTVTATKREGQEGTGYTDYWQAFCDLLAKAPDPLRPPKISDSYWIYFPLFKSGFVIYASASQQKKLLRVELALSADNHKAQFVWLHNKKAEIEAALGPLEWREMPGKSSSKIAAAKPSQVITDSTLWPEQHQWLIDKSKAFYRVFKPMIPELTALNNIAGNGAAIPVSDATNI